MRQMVRLGNFFQGAPFTATLTRGRYGATLREEARKALGERTQMFSSPAWALQSAVWWQTIEVEDIEGYRRAANRFLTYLTNEELIVRSEAALGCVQLCLELQQQRIPIESFGDVLRSVGMSVLPWLSGDEALEVFAADWLLDLLGRMRVWDPPTEPDLLGRLFYLWLHSKDRQMRERVVSTICSQRLLAREGRRPCSTIDTNELSVSFGDIPRWTLIQGWPFL